MRNKELFSKTFIDKIQQIYASSKLTNIDNKCFIYNSSIQLVSCLHSILVKNKYYSCVSYRLCYSLHRNQSKIKKKTSAIKGCASFVPFDRYKEGEAEYDC